MPQRMQVHSCADVLIERFRRFVNYTSVSSSFSPKCSHFPSCQPANDGSRRTGLKRSAVGAVLRWVVPLPLGLLVLGAWGGWPWVGDPGWMSWMGWSWCAGPGWGGPGWVALVWDPGQCRDTFSRGFSPLLEEPWWWGCLVFTLDSTGPGTSEALSKCLLDLTKLDRKRQRRSQCGCA